jgi:hypothetical protein
MTVIICKGKVKGNVVILENDAVFPEGIEVEVRLLENEPDLEKRKAIVSRFLTLGEKLKGRNVNLSKYIAESKEELEERV